MGGDNPFALGAAGDLNGPSIPAPLRCCHTLPVCHTQPAPSPRCHPPHLELPRVSQRKARKGLHSAVTLADHRDTVLSRLPPQGLHTVTHSPEFPTHEQEATSDCSSTFPGGSPGDRWPCPRPKVAASICLDQPGAPCKAAAQMAPTPAPTCHEVPHKVPHICLLSDHQEHNASFHILLYRRGSIPTCQMRSLRPQEKKSNRLSISYSWQGPQLLTPWGWDSTALTQVLPSRIFHACTFLCNL